MWLHHAKKWVSNQDPRSGIESETPSSLQTSLGLSSSYELCQVQHSVQYWPAGIWRATDVVDPTGRLLEISFADGRFDMKYRLLEHLPSHFFGSIVKTNTNRNISLGLSCPEKAPPRAVHLQESTKLVLHLFEPPTDISGPGYFLSELEFDKYVFNQLLSIEFIRPPPLTPFPTTGVLSTSLAAMTKLHNLQGLYVGHYAAHGKEVVQLRTVTDDSDAADAGFKGFYLEGRKLIGDPNVPFGKVSFMVSPSICWMGKYDQGRDDPQVFENPGAHVVRPIVKFTGEGATVVRVEERDVVATYAECLGQINQIPRMWDPEWVGATMVVYGEEEKVYSFSVIFQDLGERVRHIIDFERFEIANPKPFVPES